MILCCLEVEKILFGAQMRNFVSLHHPQIYPTLGRIPQPVKLLWLSIQVWKCTLIQSYRCKRDVSLPPQTRLIAVLKPSFLLKSLSELLGPFKSLSDFSQKHISLGYVRLSGVSKRDMEGNFYSPITIMLVNKNC